MAKLESEASPVDVKASVPIEVVEVAPPAMTAPSATVKKEEGLVLSPTTTEAQDKISEGQRRINEMWEKTQSYIALVVVIGGMFVNALLVTVVVFFNKEVSVTQLALITICLQFINLTAGIVIGFYFSRTNHEKTGGVGVKESEGPYTGR